jgi:formamidopyrimidine-DNA glycosylase
MPELPEVENIRRHLLEMVGGRTITGAEVLLPKLVGGDPPAFVREVTGRTITGARRRGKYLILELSSGYLFCHLKLSGRFIHRARPDLDRRSGAWQVALFLDDGAALYYYDLRRFGFICFRDRDPEKELKMGPEPLEPAFTLESWRKILAGRRTRIKPLLLDQARVAGIGNIYAAEALFQAGIHPDRPANSLSDEESRKLHRAIRDVLRRAVKAGGTSVSDYFKPDGTPGSFQDSLFVYQRAGKKCRRCGATVAVQKDGNRSTYYCPGCQR